MAKHPANAQKSLFQNRVFLIVFSFKKNTKETDNTQYEYRYCLKDNTHLYLGALLVFDVD